MYYMYCIQELRCKEPSVYRSVFVPPIPKGVVRQTCAITNGICPPKAFIAWKFTCSIICIHSNTCSWCCVHVHMLWDPALDIFVVALLLFSAFAGWSSSLTDMVWMSMIVAWSVLVALEGFLEWACFVKVGFNLLPNLMSIERTNLIIDTRITVQIFNQVEDQTPTKPEHL